MHGRVGSRRDVLALERMIVTSERPGSEPDTPVSVKTKLHLAVSCMWMHNHIAATSRIRGGCHRIR
jgi:hypothetical protein